MIKEKSAKIISLVVAVLAIAVIIGWLFNITILKNILPQFTDIDFIVAVCFLLSGFVLYAKAVDYKNVGSWVQFFLLFVSFLIFLTASFVLTSLYFGAEDGINSLIVKNSFETLDVSVLVKLYLPIAMFGFLTVAAIGFLPINKNKFFSVASYFLAVGLIFIGGLAVINYLTNLSRIYYGFGNVDVTIVPRILVLFIFLGFGFLTIFIKKTQIRE